MLKTQNLYVIPWSISPLLTLVIPYTDCTFRCCSWWNFLHMEFLKLIFIRNRVKVMLFWYCRSSLLGSKLRDDSWLVFLIVIIGEQVRCWKLLRRRSATSKSQQCYEKEEDFRKNVINATKTGFSRILVTRRKSYQRKWVLHMLFWYIK